VSGDDTVSATPNGSSWSRTLARLWCLKAVNAEPTGSPVPAIVLLGLGCLAAWVVIDRWQRQPDPAWALDGIPLLGWYAVGVLALAGLMRWLASPRPGFAATLALALALTPVPLTLMSIGSYVLDGPWFWCAAGAAAVYGTVLLVRGLRALCGRTQHAAALSGVIFVAAFTYASDALNAIPDVWNPADANSVVSEDQLAQREAALFEQADRIDAALEPVQRAGSGGSEAFFLGFAGVGDEKVFAQEVGLAARVLGERFHIGERRISLINDERDLEGAPIASVSGLNYALQGLAARMDLDSDVLFVAISSHGSEDPAIAVSNSQLPLQSLTPRDLAEALRDAGVQWRVVIISACYAGGFIEALRDAKTIVITAAAADRTSFGCSSDRDLTYFGEAFYRDALPAAASLRTAFETAKRAIAARERGEHEIPSEPQAYFGAQVEAKLKDLGR